ncbi:deoxyguanosinetriphosphate triphosphohydrolase family protein [Desulfovibrio caledoniensis]
MLSIQRFRKERIFSVPETLASRKTDEPISFFRSNFQRDRDRILYSKSFRRLDGKTQVFLSRSNDHIRNRLTHSLEVNQIASTTAKVLGLNGELTEAISLGHDIGHTPFGHVGERTLNLIMNNCIKVSHPFQSLEDGERGFKHNLQGVRIFSDLHSIYPNLHGTNLTNFTLYGIFSHSSSKYKKTCPNLHSGICFRKERFKCRTSGSRYVDFYDRYNTDMTIGGDVLAWSFEASVVALADEIAQRHHDIEDAIHMKIISKRDIIDKIIDCFRNVIHKQEISKLHAILNEKSYFTSLISQFIVNLYNLNLIRNSRYSLLRFVKSVYIKNRTDFKNSFTLYSPKITQNVIRFSDEFLSADKRFQEFLRSTILNSHKAQRMDGKGSFIIEKLFKAYFTNPRQLHDSTILAAFNMYEGKSQQIENISKIQLGDYRNIVASAEMRSNPFFEKSLMRAICDHIAGMTDNFVIEEYSRLYGEKPV